MSTRQEILHRVRLQLPQSAPLPALEDDWVRYPDPVAQFAAVLESVGGRCEVVKDYRQADERLRLLDAYASAEVRLSAVEGVGSSTIDLDETGDPHELERVGFAVLPGELAVAENAAVWVRDIRGGGLAAQEGGGPRAISLRVLYFLSQHVGLVVRKSAVVHNMHEAYERIGVGSEPFGTFISGPSKTADIEQALVIGAHGARSLTVYLVEEDGGHE